MSYLGRAIGIIRTSSKLLRRGPQRMTLRNGSGGPHIEPQYRQYPQITKKQIFESELLSGAMWFWILWHCWHDPDAVLVCHSNMHVVLTYWLFNKWIELKAFVFFDRVTSLGLTPPSGPTRNWVSHLMRNDVLIKVHHSLGSILSYC
uniref:NADH dehydrogenase [ubiquinone] 1 beta subcomplex subunit 2, mitochondrial n=1 Tax=Neogobius melanostomus TaxID=47308 RepID=A0A8C6T6L4_9GOBI